MLLPHIYFEVIFWYYFLVLFPDSSMAEQFAVNEKVAGSSPARGANKLDTNSFFEDESVRSPSPATSGAGLAFATASPSLWREMKRILMLSGEINFFFLKTNNIKI
jgi:hypothetical protein